MTSMRCVPGAVVGCLLFFYCARVKAQDPATASSEILPEPPSTSLKAKPQDTALAFERAGRTAEAAAIYEEIARTNAAARKVLAHRLVKIYTETSQTNKALTWAHEVMRDNPHPKAYLAGVYTQLGDLKQAQGILEHEITVNTNITCAVTLRWQLAEVFEALGERSQAHHALEEAVVKAQGTGMESAARQRLESVNETSE